MPHYDSSIHDNYIYFMKGRPSSTRQVSSTFPPRTTVAQDTDDVFHSTVHSEATTDGTEMWPLTSLETELDSNTDIALTSDDTRTYRSSNILKYDSVI